MASDIHSLNLGQNGLFDGNSQLLNSFSSESTDYSALANLNSSSNDLSISSLSLDVDGNGIVEANRDGLLIYGYLNVRNIPVPSLMDQLANNLADPNGIRNTGSAIRAYLEQGLSSMLEVDGNNAVEANRDGLLSYGYLNVRNIPVPSLMNQLANNLADPDGIRNTGTDIRDFLADYLEINEAPVFQPVNDLTVIPGDRLEVQLSAIDPEGEEITFALQGEDLPAGNLSPDGKLVFNPTPEELGQYQVTLIASDGEVETSQVVNLSVIADPVTTTRLTGIIADVNETPLAGVVVSVGGVNATTNNQGKFTLEFLGEVTGDDFLRIKPGQQVNNAVYPNIAEKIDLLLENGFFNGFNNIIPRPIYLPKIDMSNAKTINPNQNITVTTNAIPKASVFVQAGSLKDPQGNLYTGQMSITEVPRDLTPAALPSNVIPDIVVTIQPGEMRFNTPAPLSLPNNAGYAPGTELDLWSINPTTGQFDNVGTGRVSNDGTVINTINGGIRNSSWHFFAPPPETPENPENDDRNEDDGCDDCKGSVSGTSEVQLHSGAVIENHDLVSYQSLGVDRGLSLVYDSQRADARPILHFGYQNVVANPNRRLMAELSFSSGNFEYQVPGFAGGFGLNGGEHFWKIPNGGGSIDAALQADLRFLESGRYDYALTTGLVQFNNNSFNGSTSTSTGEILHVNGVGGVFGNGWGLAGWQELVENDDGSVLLIDGDGGELLFEAPLTAGEAYQNPAGDFSTLEKLNNGTFRRTMKDQTVYIFNSNDKLASVSDRNGNKTSYVYNAQGNLSKIIDPVGLETNFSYTNGKVTKIVDPANRETKLQYDKNGNLTRITDPDGTSRQWDYDADFHIIQETDKRGNIEKTFYDFAGRADSAIRKDGSTLDFNPVQVQGLYAPTATIDPVNAPPALQLSDTPESVYMDANGDEITYRLDQAGQIIDSFDEVGLLPSVERNEDNLVTISTDARRNITEFTYDDQGNVITIKDNITLDNNSALSFDGNDYVNVGNRPDLELTNNFTLEAIIKPAGSSDGIIINKEGEYEIARFGNGTIRWAFANSNPGWNWISTGYVVPENQTTHLAITYESGVIKTYADGVLVHIYNGSGTLGDSVSSQDDFRIGGRQWTSSQKFQGEIDEVRIWDVIRSEADILANINTTLTGNENGLIGYWNFDNINGDIVPDLSINGNDGTIIGATEVKSILKAEKQFTYDSNFNQLTSQTDELGNQTLYQIDANNGNTLSITQVIGEVGGNDDLITRFTYTNKGLIDTTTDPKGFVTDYDYDSFGRLTSVTFAKSTTDQATRTYQYDSAGNQTLVIDEEGNRTEFEYDGLNRLTKIIEADPDGNGALTSPITTYTYDSAGNLKTTTDSRNNATEYEYDELDRVSTITDELDNVTTYGYDSLGNLTSVIDPNNNQTQYIYDDRDRLVANIDPENVITRFTYDLNNNLTSVIENAGSISSPSVYILASGNEVSDQAVVNVLEEADLSPTLGVQPFEWNGTQADLNNFDAVIILNNYNWNSGDMPIAGQTAIVDFITNGGGLVTSEWLNWNVAFANRFADLEAILPSISTAFNGNPSTTYVENIADSIINDGLPLSFEFSMQNIGGTESFLEPKDGATVFYDSSNTGTGGLIGWEYEQGRTISFSTLITEIELDDPEYEILFSNAVEWVINYSVNNGFNRTRFEYDSRNRLISETDPLGTITTYEYDAVDNLISQRDRNNRVIEYEYDDVYRLTTETWQDSDQVINYSYDKNGNLTSVNDKFSALTFTYDARNRLISESNAGTPNIPQVVLNYRYDDVGNVISLSDRINGTNRGTNNYSYDALNRLTRLTQSGSNVSNKRLDLTYNPLGQYDTISRYSDLNGNNLVNQSTYTYDNLNRLERLAHNNGSSDIAFYDFEYDPASRISKITDIDGFTNYSYDDRDQLTGANHSDTDNPDETYEYDANGNRINSSTHGENYLIGDGNRLLSDGVYNYEYDAEGNMIKRTDIATGAVQEYQWDYRNRMIAVIDKNSNGNETQKVGFTYDALDRRIAKTVDATPATTGDGVVTYFVYDGENVHLEFTDNDGVNGANQPQLSQRYLHGAGVDQIMAQEDKNGNVTWLLSDHLGTIRDLVDNDGDVVNHLIYDSFGQVIAESDPNIDTRYLFTGREFDEETGLYYYRARYYDAEIGRFINEDPIGFDGGDENLYRYVGNNPILFKDPFGEETIKYNGQIWQRYDNESREPNNPSPHQRRGDHYINKETGERFWPESGEIEDKYGNREQASKTFQKGFREVLNERAKNRAARSLAKKGAGALAKKIPVVLICTFTYDLFTEGPAHAVNEATWPVSELWID